MTFAVLGGALVALVMSLVTSATLLGGSVYFVVCVASSVVGALWGRRRNG